MFGVVDFISMSFKLDVKNYGVVATLSDFPRTRPIPAKGKSIL